MTVGVIAIIKVQDGKNKEFEAEFNKLAEQVLATESGCSFYALHRSKSDLQTYKVLEQYENMDALEAHRHTAHYKAANTALAELVSAPPNIEVLDGVN